MALQLMLFLDMPWEAARGYLRDDLEHLQAVINTRTNTEIVADGILGDETAVTRYVANTGPNNDPTWDTVNLANGVQGRLVFSHLVAASAGTVIGRRSASAGDYEALTLDTGLTATAGALLRATPRLLASVTLDAQVATIPTTTAFTTTTAGVYRVTYYLRKTRAGASSSSATVTLSWTDGTVACSQAFAALTTNTTAAVQSGSVLVRADAASVIAYDVVYATG